MYPEVEGGNVQVVYKDQNAKTEVQGVPPNYVSIRNAAPYYGRFFTEKENLTLARVAVIGQTIITFTLREGKSSRQRNQNQSCQF